jgi:hypothetical protein
MSNAVQKVDQKAVPLVPTPQEFAILVDKMRAHVEGRERFHLGQIRQMRTHAVVCKQWVREQSERNQRALKDMFDALIAAENRTTEEVFAKLDEFERLSSMVLDQDA